MNNGGWKDAVAEAMTTIENIIRICDHKAKGGQLAETKNNDQRPTTTTTTTSAEEDK